MDDLERHWPLASRRDLRDLLLDAYAGPGRYYHDTRHLAEVLGHLDTLLAHTTGVDRDAVVLAAWFHDAVYDGRADDEERSAALAERTLAPPLVPPSLAAEVARLVRLTHEHRPAPDDLAGRVLCDADLAILAAEEVRYDEYVHAVRQEYAHLDEDAFREGRSRVLRHLVSAPALFHTAYARQEWEDRARLNVARELESLGPAGPA